MRRREIRIEKENIKEILTGPGDLRIEADAVASLSEEDSEVTTTFLQGMIRLLFTSCFLRTGWPCLRFLPISTPGGDGGL